MIRINEVPLNPGRCIRPQTLVSRVARADQNVSISAGSRRSGREHATGHAIEVRKGRDQPDGAENEWETVFIGRNRAPAGPEARPVDYRLPHLYFVAIPPRSFSATCEQRSIWVGPSAPVALSNDMRRQNTPSGIV